MVLGFDLCSGLDAQLLERVGPEGLGPLGCRGHFRHIGQHFQEGVGSLMEHGAQIPPLQEPDLNLLIPELNEAALIVQDVTGLNLIHRSVEGSELSLIRSGPGGG